MIVAALGYFVDIYDLTIFGVVRIESLESLNLDVDKVGSLIINWQMFGLLVGGILWGVLGDKRGRLSVLFGSIIVYSVANIACGFIPQMQFMDTATLYCILRFIAGVGLAGELGAGITLVAESLPKELRAIGTSLVAGFGLLGAVVAKLTVGFSGDWTITYFIGGGLGLALLFLRIGVVESGMFKDIVENDDVKKGSFISFFTNKKRFIKYIKCIAIGLPTWFCIGIFAFFGNQFAVPLGIDGKIDPGACIMWAYIGISAGDFASGFLSHLLNSRKKGYFLDVNIYSFRSGSIISWSSKYCEYVLCIYGLVRIRNRLLGNVCYCGSGAIWNKYSIYCCNNYPEHGTWQFTIDGYLI